MLETIGKAKVGDDDVAMAVKEEILELEISVNDLLLMNIPYAGNELREEFGSVAFTQIAMGKDVVEEFTS